MTTLWTADCRGDAEVRTGIWGKKFSTFSRPSTAYRLCCQGSRYGQEWQTRGQAESFPIKKQATKQMACQRSKSIHWAFSATDGTLINNCSCQEAVIVCFPYRFLPFTFICFNVQSFVWCEFHASFSHSVNSLSILYCILLCMSVWFFSLLHSWCCI